MESIIQNIIKQKKKTFSVLFVCSGNICRSPMAEILYEQIVQSDPLPSFDKVISRSAGVVYQWSGGMDDYAESVLREFYQISKSRLNAFRSCHIRRDSRRFQEADLIITMEQSHLYDIPAEYHRKTFTLKEAATGVSGDVEDPYGGNLATYHATAKEIHQLLKLFHHKIKSILS
ncbi:MAG: arsenate reductase/protein-tyrosine-phosphatase family protein [Candidatus Helarchaeota archaeon]